MHLYRTITFQMDDIIFQEEVLTPIDIIFHNDGVVTTNNVTDHKLVQNNEQFLELVKQYQEHPETCIVRGDIIKTCMTPCGPEGKLVENEKISIE